jgi:hypothetical protein
VERLSRSLFDACVDLNPHQIEAALFALRSPISKGVVLADEVGLGKTIEAGLVLMSVLGGKTSKAAGHLPGITAQTVGTGTEGEIQPSIRGAGCKKLPRCPLQWKPQPV